MAINRARECGFEPALQMRAAIVVIDVVGRARQNGVAFRNHPRCIAGPLQPPWVQFPLSSL